MRKQSFISLIFEFFSEQITIIEDVDEEELAESDEEDTEEEEEDIGIEDDETDESDGSIYNWSIPLFVYPLFVFLGALIDKLSTILHCFILFIAFL